MQNARMQSVLFWSVLVPMVVAGCSTAENRFEDVEAEPGAAEMARQPAEAAATQTTSPPAAAPTLDTINQRLLAIEEKLQSHQATLDQFIVSQKSIVSGVVPHAAENSGIAVQDLSLTATKAGDPGLDLYRQSVVLFDSEKYAESQASFGTFVQQHPDHALAASAQFYLAESYFKQSDLKSAKPEYEKILVAYDRSSYVPDALARLADCDPSGQHRQLLLSLFPSSPPALAMMRVRETPLAAMDPPPAAAPADSGKLPAALAPMDPSPEEDMALVP